MSLTKFCGWCKKKRLFFQVKWRSYITPLGEVAKSQTELCTTCHKGNLQVFKSMVIDKGNE